MLVTVCVCLCVDINGLRLYGWQELDPISVRTYKSLLWFGCCANVIQEKILCGSLLFGSHTIKSQHMGHFPFFFINNNNNNNNKISNSAATVTAVAIATEKKLVIEKT